ncbi:MAG: DNA-directed RNA polymerase subunit D [Candidatus Diapherotrites archaeon]|nr:DNA-directed RNA polymerase subunit D [Candidatus Diapherotrites archaeon]
MEIKKVSEDNNVSRFVVKGATTTFMNAIRRSAMAHVPVLAIETVSVYENDSVMFDEMLAHRLGLLPVKTDTKSYKEGDKVKLVLEKEGPCTVYSKDIKCADPKIEIASAKIPITKLKKGQKLKLEMEAVMSTGKENSKWQPGIIAFNEVPKLVQKNDSAKPEDILKKAPKDVFELKGKKISMVDPYTFHYSKEKTGEISGGALALDYESDEFVLTVESSGSLPANEILEQAAEALKAKAEEFRKELSKL